MQYIVGVDGGGTKTRIRLADIDGNPLACWDGGPANIHTMQPEAFEATLARALTEAVGLIDGQPSDCRMLCLGMAGAGRPRERSVIRRIVHDMGFDDRTVVTDDALTALYGGTGSGIGVILISGTGSICYGRNMRGDTHRSGGWGYLTGDEGSGYEIGRRALVHTLRSLDGREKKSVLSDLVMERLGVENCDGIVQLVYESGKARQIIAGLADLADMACAMGDRYASGILSNAAGELYKCAEAVILALDFENQPFQVVLAGSVMMKSQVVYKEFSKRIEKKHPEAEVLKCRRDAAWGAIGLARDIINGKDIVL